MAAFARVADRLRVGAHSPAAALAVLAGAVLASFNVAAAVPTVLVTQGGVARWADLAAVECGFHGKRYPAVDAVCYYPVDLRAKAGVHEIALYDQDGKQHLGALNVEAVEWLAG